MGFIGNLINAGCGFLDTSSKAISIVEKAKETKEVWDAPAHSRKEKIKKGVTLAANTVFMTSQSVEITASAGSYLVPKSSQPKSKKRSYSDYISSNGQVDPSFPEVIQDLKKLRALKQMRRDAGIIAPSEQLLKNLGNIRTHSQNIANISGNLGNVLKNSEGVPKAEIAKQVFFIMGDAGNMLQQCDRRWMQTNKHKIEMATKLANAAGNFLYCSSAFRRFSITKLVAEESREIHNELISREIRDTNLAIETFNRANELINQVRNLKNRLENGEIITEIPSAISRLLENDLEICPITRQIILYASIVEDPHYRNNPRRRWRYYDKYALRRTLDSNQHPPRWPLNVPLEAASINQTVSEFNTSRTLNLFEEKMDDIIQKQQQIMLAMQSLVQSLRQNRT